MVSVQITETDWGTKRKTMLALKRVIAQAIPREITGALREYCEELWRTSFALAPKETGTLANSIRFEKREKASQGFEVERYSYDLGEWKIKAGGTEFINPRTKMPVDYAQAVHDGHMTKSGSWVPGQPFLSMAVELVGDAGFQKWIDLHWSKIAGEWIRD